MGRKLNSINFGSGFNITSTSPIDSRTRVENVSDLINPSTWSSDTGPLYQGIPVTVESTGDIYVLLGKPEQHTDINFWKKQNENDASKIKLSENINIEGETVAEKDTSAQDAIKELFKRIIENEEVTTEALLSLDQKIGDIEDINELGADNVVGALLGVIEKLAQIDNRLTILENRTSGVTF